MIKLKEFWERSCEPIYFDNGDLINSDVMLANQDRNIDSFYCYLGRIFVVLEEEDDQNT